MNLALSTSAQGRQIPMAIGGSSCLFDMGTIGVLKMSYPIKPRYLTTLRNEIDRQRSFWVARENARCVKVTGMGIIQYEQSSRLCIEMENLSGWKSDECKFQTMYPQILMEVRGLWAEGISYFDVEPRNVLFSADGNDFKLVDLPIGASFGQDLIFSIDEVYRANYIRAHRNGRALGQTTVAITTVGPNIIPVVLKREPITTLPGLIHSMDSLTSVQGEEGG